MCFSIIVGTFSGCPLKKMFLHLCKWLYSFMHSHSLQTHNVLTIKSVQTELTSPLLLCPDCGISMTTPSSLAAITNGNSAFLFITQEREYDGSLVNNSLKEELIVRLNYNIISLSNIYTRITHFTDSVSVQGWLCPYG